MYHSIKTAKCSMCEEENNEAMWAWMRGNGITGDNVREWSNAYYEWRQTHKLPEVPCVVIEHDGIDISHEFAICKRHMQELIGELEA